MFTTQFNKYACINDAVTCNVGNFTFVARIEHDSDYRPGNDDCWSESDIARWKNDEWYFVGIVLSAQYNGIDLECNESLWGIECNFGEDNNYLMEVANDLLLQFDYESARKDVIQKLS